MTHIFRGMALLCCLFTGLQAAPHQFRTANNSKNCIKQSQTCDDGLTLEQATTTCRVQTQHRLGGPLDLNGGTLSFERDMTLAPHATVLTGGQIDGQGNTLTLAYQHDAWQFPMQENCYGVYSEAPLQPTSLIGGAAWYSDATTGPLFAVADYLAPGSLRVYAQRGYELIERASVSLPIGTGAHHIQWCPAAPMGVFSAKLSDGSMQLYLFAFDATANVITLTQLMTESATYLAAAWSANGNRLVVTTTDEVMVYERSGAYLVQSMRADFAATTGASAVVCAWHPIGQKYVIARQLAADLSELLVYQVTGAVPVLIGRHEVAGVVSVLDFSLPSPDQFLIGLSSAPTVHDSRLHVGTLTHDATTATIELSTPYDVEDDIYAFAWDARRAQCALLTRQEGGVAQLALYNAAYDARDASVLPTLTRSAVHIHTNLYSQLAWARHDQQLAIVDQSGGLHRFTTLDGMMLKNLTLVGHSDVAWHGGLYVQGNVLCAAHGHAWQLPAYGRWRLDNGARLTVHNARLQLDTAFNIYSAGAAQCVLDSCSITGGNLSCQVPTTLRGVCHISGTISGNVVLADHAQLILDGDTHFDATVQVAGQVTIFNNGHTYEVDETRISLAPGATVTIHEGGSGGGVRTTSSVAQIEGPALIDEPLHTLSNDVLVTSETSISITTNTTINGGGHTIMFSGGAAGFDIDESVTSLTLSNVILDGLALESLQQEGLEVVIAGDSVIRLGRDTTLNTMLHCVGHTQIDGAGHALTLGVDGVILSMGGSTTTLCDISLYNVRGRGVACASPDSQVVFKRAQIHLVADWMLPDGLWTMLQGVRIIGPHAVVHSGSVIMEHGSTLTLSEGAEWRYAATDASLVCLGNAKLVLDNAAFASYVVCDMTGARMLLRGHVLFRDEGGGLAVKAEPQSGSFVHVYGDVTLT